MADEAIGVCSVEQMKEILAAVRWLRQSGFMLLAGQKKPAADIPPGKYIGVVTEEITARDGTTPGIGKATIKYMPGDATVIKDFPEAGACEVTIKNITSSSVDVDKYISFIKEDASGHYVIILEDCV